MSDADEAKQDQLVVGDYYLAKAKICGHDRYFIGVLKHALDGDELLVTDSDGQTFRARSVKRLRAD